MIMKNPNYHNPRVHTSKIIWAKDNFLKQTGDFEKQDCMRSHLH